jgi:hypothetical protein
MKRITFTQAQALAAEKGVKLVCESERHFHRNGVITDSWYKLDTLPDKEFTLLTDVWDFLINHKPGSLPLIPGPDPL